MWANVFGSLQNDLTAFAKELSAGVPSTTKDASAAAATSGATRTCSVGTAPNDRQHGDGQRAGDDRDGFGSGDATSSISQTAARTRQPRDAATDSERRSGGAPMDKTFLLDWGSSDEDEDDDDITAEWEQVTKITLASGSKQAAKAAASGGKASARSRGAPPPTTTDSAAVREALDNASSRPPPTSSSASATTTTTSTTTATPSLSFSSPPSPKTASCSEVEALQSALAAVSAQRAAETRELDEARETIHALRQHVGDQDQQLRLLQAKVAELTRLSAELRATAAAAAAAEAGSSSSTDSAGSEATVEAEPTQS
jgi:hypothetical protein